MWFDFTDLLDSIVYFTLSGKSSAGTIFQFESKMLPESFQQGKFRFVQKRLDILKFDKNFTYL